MKNKMVFLFFLATIFLLTGCTVAESVKALYPLEAYDYGENNTTSKVYRAFDKSIEEVSKELMEKNEPKESSPIKDDRMFLVYDDYLVQLMKDIEQPNDTLVQVMPNDFVSNTYNNTADIGLLEAYLVASIVDDVFDVGYKSGYYKNKKKGYGGYISTSGKYHKSAVSSGSLRTGSTGSKGVRGGGPGTGK